MWNGYVSWHGILLEEPNPNREPPKRPNWALCRSQYRKPHPPNTQGRARGKRKTQPGERSSWGGGRANRGSTAARPTLTRDWGGPQVRDPVPVVSVNPEADPPHPRAPIRPKWAEQGRGRKKRPRRENGRPRRASRRCGAVSLRRRARCRCRVSEAKRGEVQHKERGKHSSYSRGKPSTCG